MTFAYFLRFLGLITQLFGNLKLSSFWGYGHKESAPTPAEISACVMKIINETRQLFINGSLKYEKVDPELVIPDEIESLLEKSGLGSAIKSGSTELDLSASSSNTGILLGNPNEIDSLRRKIVELNQIIMLLKKDNTTMKDKLDKIKKIA
ncbi:MAG: hypothetical protein ACK41T_03800 [Pseudobdellovibrio sp.]